MSNAQPPEKTSLFFEACASGDLEALRNLLLSDKSLVRLNDPQARHGGWTGLHTAARAAHIGAVRLLLEHGADPNAREAGDNTYPLHWAAAHRHLEIVRALLDAGGDVHGFGDVHELDAIGWATFFHAPGGAPGDSPEAAGLLVERGARHHIFSAISIGDLNLIRTLVEQNPKLLHRRMSRFEKGMTPLHFAMSLKRYDILDLLIELGADLEAKDLRGKTALEAATLSLDREAISRLEAAGAKPPAPIPLPHPDASLAELAGSVSKGVPMIYVPDVARALDWYSSIGFKEMVRYEDDGLVNFGMVSFGGAEIMVNMHGKKGPHDVSLWFYTDRINDIYQLMRNQQIEFEQDIEDMFYGARQFGIRDLNGYVLYFIQDLA
jgi:ankyrin repeat protein/uncharacterized glyoxalase superfamily protein PhnB